jgi:hypothetical protein
MRNHAFSHHGCKVSAKLSPHSNIQSFHIPGHYSFGVPPVSLFCVQGPCSQLKPATLCKYLDAVLSIYVC